jgi:glycine/D-amino acid oxidase-like deaminating enzyme
VLVAGGGTAGSAAAVSAARLGARVLLVEQSNALGGTSTTGMLQELYASLEGLGNVFDDVRRELAAYGASQGRFYNSEYLKIAWQALADRAGVDILFHAQVCGARREGPRLTVAQVACRGQSLDLEASYFIDATGQGDLAAAAGASFALGHPQSRLVLHMSLPFLMVDTGRPVVRHLPDDCVPISDWGDAPGLHVAEKLWDGRLYCNMTKVIRHDPTDPASLSAAEREARRQLVRCVEFLQRTRFPTFTLAASAGCIGIREGRRIVGDYTISEADVLSLEPRDFADGVAVATSQIDFHSLTRGGHGGWRAKVHPYAIPLRAMLPLGLDNLLTAGKCISGDQVALSSYRMTPTCCAMGQAAGAAAAMCVRSGLASTRELDARMLREQLRADGMELDPSRHQAFAPELGGGKRDTD